MGDSETGAAIRRAVLGDEHVDRALARSTPFDADFQDYLTRCVWGEAWSRPQLDRRTRRQLTLAVLMALDCADEVAMHVRAALRDGMPAEEIAEVFLHAAPYTGVPRANRAFAVARQVLAEEERDAATK